MATKIKNADKRPSSAKTTVALKALMAVTGLIMIGFLLAHMLGNLWIFAGRDQFNEYAHHIRTIGEPMLPNKTLLWLLRLLLLFSVLAHIYSAATLWKRNKHAVGGSHRYQTKKNRKGVQRTYASFTMRWGGVIVLLFVVYHLMHLTANTIHPGGASDSPYDRVVNGFSIWWVVLSYTIAMIALGFHLRHGIWSAFASLGLNKSPRTRARYNAIAVTLSSLIIVGFLVPPFSILFGWIG